MGRALILAGGGITGIAWESGVLAGLEAGGFDSQTYVATGHQEVWIISPSAEGRPGRLRGWSSGRGGPADTLNIG